MTLRPARVALAVAVGATALALVASSASGASWKGPVYPKGAVSTNLSLAVTPSGKATVLFQGPRRSISAVSRAGAGAAWATKPVTWLAAGEAAVNGPLAAGFSGSRLAALWTSGASLRSAAGSQGRATTRVRARTVTPRVGAISLSPAVGPSLRYSLASAAGSSMGTMAPGTLPSALPSAAGNPPPGLTVLHQDNDAAGNVTALVLMSPTQVGVMTRPAGGAWSAVSPLPTPLQTAFGAGSVLGAGTLTALDVSPQGDAAVAIVTNTSPSMVPVAPANTIYSVAVMQRQGPTGTFGAPALVPNTQVGWFGGFEVVPPVAVAISRAAVVVGWGAGSTANNGSWAAGGGVAILSSIAAPGQPFPAATSTPIGSTENWSPDGLVAAVTPTGMGAVMMWGDGAQGDIQDLGVTTSAGPGRPWSKEFNVAGRNAGDQGYPDAGIVAFNKGFVAAWSACVTTDPGSNPTCRVGVASFQ